MRMILAVAICCVATMAQAGGPVPASAEPKLAEIVDTFAAHYLAAPNKMAAGKVRLDRGHALCAPPLGIKAAEGHVKDWTGTVETLDSTSDGHGILAVRIASDVTVRTTNNGFSDSLLEIPTLIPGRSALMATAAALSVGQRVRFSGVFLPSVEDCMKEQSLTVEGGMTAPEFLFQFTAVAPTD